MKRPTFRPRLERLERRDAPSAALAPAGPPPLVPGGLAVAAALVPSATHAASVTPRIILQSEEAAVTHALNPGG